MDTDSIQQQLLEAQRLMQQQVALPPLLLLRHAEPTHHGTADQHKRRTALLCDLCDTVPRQLTAQRAAVSLCASVVLPRRCRPAECTHAVALA